MTMKLTRRASLLAMSATLAFSVALPSFAEDKVQLRLSTSASESDNRSVAFEENFGPAVEDFASYEPSYNSTLFAQGTEPEEIARGNLEMAFVSAQELAQYIPEFSIFTAGYVMQDADHQVAVFNDEVMDQFKELAADKLNMELLAVMYLGRRQVNLRQPKSDLEVMTPEDLAGVNLRMPGTDSWQFLGAALGASPTPMDFAEVYTGLQTGAIDGQDNPLPTMVDKKFYEVTKQVVLTSHLVDLNFIGINKDTWESFTPEQQEQVQAGVDAAVKANMDVQLEKEAELVSFLEEQGLDVYEPDVAAFRDQVQMKYQESDFANDWPEGALEQINALGN